MALRHPPPGTWIAEKHSTCDSRGQHVERDGLPVRRRARLSWAPPTFSLYGLPFWVTIVARMAPPVRLRVRGAVADMHRRSDIQQHRNARIAGLAFECSRWPIHAGNGRRPVWVLGDLGSRYCDARHAQTDWGSWRTISASIEQLTTPCAKNMISGRPRRGRTRPGSRFWQGLP